MPSHPSFSSPLINEDLPAGPQLVFTLNNRFFRHQACYSLLPAKPGGQADRVISLCKYKVVGLNPRTRSITVTSYSTVCTCKTPKTREKVRWAIWRITGSYLSLVLLGRGAWRWLCKWGGGGLKGVGGQPHYLQTWPKLPSSLNKCKKVAITRLRVLYSLCPRLWRI